MPASIDSKPLTQTLSPLDATLMKKGGWGRRPPMGAESMTNAAPNNSTLIVSCRSEERQYSRTTVREKGIPQE